MMEIAVELFGQLAVGKQAQQNLNLDHAMEIQDVVVLLGLNPELIGLITINGVQSELEDKVAPGCRLCLFPPMSGG